jgi:hypothetical protein
MTKKDILIRYRQIVIEIGTIEKQLEFLDRYIGGPQPVRSPQITGMPRGTNNPEAAMIQQEEEYYPIKDLMIKQEELKNYLPEFNKIVCAIEDDRTRNIIRQYFALGWSDGRIANYQQPELSSKRVYQIRQDFMKTLD